VGLDLVGNQLTGPLEGAAWGDTVNLESLLLSENQLTGEKSGVCVWWGRQGRVGRGRGTRTLVLPNSVGCMHHGRICPCHMSEWC
jgi:hypothetical protein